MVAEIEEDEAFKNIKAIKTFLITGLIRTGILVVILVLLFSYYLVNPIKKLIGAVRKIFNGDLDTKIPIVKSNDEIQELTSVMEVLVASIKYLKKNKK